MYRNIQGPTRPFYVLFCLDSCCYENKKSFWEHLWDSHSEMGNSPRREEEAPWGPSTAVGHNETKNAQRREGKIQDLHRLTLIFRIRFVKENFKSGLKLICLIFFCLNPSNESLSLGGGVNFQEGQQQSARAAQILKAAETPSVEKVAAF